MKKLIICIATFLSVGCAQLENHSENHAEILNGFMKGRRDCRSAENYARNIQGNEGYRFYALGIVHLKCYMGEEKAGIEYLKYAAQKGNTSAVDTLISYGEKPPEPPKVIYKERIVQQPTPQPQQIIIQQQPAVILPGPSRGAVINPTFNPFGR
jgi:hypothetical protein